MSKIPCRKCPGCGLYHGVSALVCDECGRELKIVSALLVETEEIPGELYGEINEDATVYVQKCSACGALNFSASIDEPVKVCYNCHKTRIASIIPVEYVVNEGSDGASADGATGKDSDGAEATQEEKVSRGVFALEDDEETRDDVLDQALRAKSQDQSDEGTDQSDQRHVRRDGTAARGIQLQEHIACIKCCL